MFLEQDIKEIQYDEIGIYYESIPVNKKWEDIIKSTLHVIMSHPLLNFYLSSNAQCDIWIVSNSVISKMNEQFRAIPKPTNVLSFPTELKKDQPIQHLGDIVLAFFVLKKESQEYHIPLFHHVRHLLIHGFLHLLGFDHDNNTHSMQMESLEISLLQLFDIPNPYETVNYK